jgi:hypothetical protein
MQSLFDALRLNDNNQYDVNSTGDVKLVRVYSPTGVLIAKKKQRKKHIQYFGVKGCEDFLE